MNSKNILLTNAQLKAELNKCEYCEEKPCKEACPANCSPADFIMAAKMGRPSDYKRASYTILKSNPLGTVCGVLCPDSHCMSACVHKNFDTPVNIPAVQATIIAKARELGVLDNIEAPKSNGKKLAVLGAGPSGLGAAGFLARKGYEVDIFDSAAEAGGMCTYIPDFRLPPNMLKDDISFLEKIGKIKFNNNAKEENPEALLAKGYEGLIVATGLAECISMKIDGEKLAVTWKEYLGAKDAKQASGRVAVIGGGATAVDCALEACRRGASGVEMFVLETLDEMPITDDELHSLLRNTVEITNRTRVTKILDKEKGKLSLEACKIKLDGQMGFNLNDLKNLEGSTHQRSDFDLVVIAVGNRTEKLDTKKKGIFYTGDYVNGPTTVVEAVADGKNAAAELHSFCSGDKIDKISNRTKSYFDIEGYDPAPVNIKSDFFGIPINSPFLLSASPLTDGLEQMKKAYEAGWAGGIMKTAFDGIPIHIPGEYMFTFNELTYGNCDNVSGHSLTRVCKEIGELRELYPDRLTMASTGGPVTGNDEEDKKGWQSNTKKLEEAGAMGIEYSLSCPQGGDGTEGDIVSQNAALTAKIIDWILEVSDPNIPKLFKLTSAVTSVKPILKAIEEVLQKYKDKKAGITLANSFPALGFRDGNKKTWEEGVVVGLSGDGVSPISYLALANASSYNIAISGNGGPMDYLAAANFLALGTKTVQFCTVATKYGYGIIDELHSGLSYLMQARGIKSVNDLIGCALPNPITDFMELTPIKKISACNEDLCLSCGNCARCPYLAISINHDGRPETDPVKCIGCSICAKKCFSGALYLRERTDHETMVLKED